MEFAKYGSLKEFKKIETDNQKIQNNIIKIKNFFFSLLYNYPTLSKNEIIPENLNNIINILKDIKNNSITKAYSYSEQNIKEKNSLFEPLFQYLPLLLAISVYNQIKNYLI